MENIEQLKQDNDKLVERLNNAAKIFREQKSQIEQLTKEIEDLKSNQSTADDSTINELTKKFENSDAAYEELRKKYAELKELHDTDIDRYNELKANYEGEQNTIQSKDQEYKVLQYTHNKVVEELADTKIELSDYEKMTSHLQDQVTKLKADNDVLSKSKKEYQEAYEQQKKENKETEEQFNKVLSSYEHDLEEEKEKMSLLSKQYDALEIVSNTQKNDIEKLNKLYDECENEKLSWQIDYQNLKEQFDQLQLQADIDKECSQRYEEIWEDYEKCKEFINDIYTKAKSFSTSWKMSENVQETKTKQETNKVKKAKTSQSQDSNNQFRNQNLPMLTM